MAGEAETFRNELKAAFARLDERTINIQETISDLKGIIATQHKDINETLENEYTKKAEFEPIKKVVYGFVGFLLLSIGGMFVTVVVHKNNLPAEVSTQHSIVKPLEK